VQSQLGIPVISTECLAFQDLDGPDFCEPATGQLVHPSEGIGNELIEIRCLGTGQLLRRPIVGHSRLTLQRFHFGLLRWSPSF
jgi:hypothetical protein